MEEIFEILNKKKKLKIKYFSNKNFKHAIHFVRSIENSPWFEKIMKPNSKIDRSFRVYSLNEAIYLLPSLWSIRGFFYEKVLDKAEFLKMEDDLYFVTKEVRIYIQKKTGIWDKVASPVEMNQAYGCLSSDISFAAGSIFLDCQESTRFFASYIKYYIKGYWPCGWQGIYPNGKFFVL